MTDDLQTNSARLIHRFLDRIEGAGYGGMANYEIARREASALSDAIEIAYGLLWLAAPSRETWDGIALAEARKALLAHLDKAGQARGIEAARQMME